jgi:hypothetical protein
MLVMSLMNCLLSIPPIFMADAFGVAPPSLSSAPFAGAGEDWKKRGD